MGNVTMKENIEINIEELKLQGFSHIDRYRIGEALQSELTRLFTEHEIPTSLTRRSEIAKLDGGKFNISLNSRAEVIGTQIANSIYNRFSK